MGPLAGFKGLRPTAGQGPKQRAGCSRGSVRVVVVVVVFVVVVVVGPAAAHDADEARISSIICAYFRLMLAHVSPSGATSAEKWKKQKTL